MRKNTFHTLLAGQQEDLRRAKGRVTALKACRAKIEADLRIARQIAGALRLDTYVHSYMTYDNEPRANLTATVSVYVSSFKSDRKLTNVLNRTLEFAEASGSSDYVADWIAERTYEFKLPKGGLLKVEARLKDEAASCQRVQVGTKFEETPVFEIRCN